MKTVGYNDVLYRAAELAGRTRDKLPVSEAKMMQGYFAVDLQGVWNAQAWPELIPDFYQAAPNGRAVTKSQGATPVSCTITVSTDGTSVASATITAIVTAVTLVPGDQVVVSGGADAWFNGTFIVASVTDATHFTYTIVPQGAASAEVGHTCVITKAELGDVLGVYTANPRVTTRYRGVSFTEGDNTIWLDEGLALVFVEYMLPRIDLMSVLDANLAATNLPAIFSNYLALRAAGHLLRSDSQFASGDEMLALGEAALVREIQRLPPAPAWRQVGLRRDFGRLPALTNL